VRYGTPASEFWLEALASDGLLGTRFELVGRGVRLPVTLPLPGRHQADNLLAAATTAMTLGIEPEQVVEVAAALRPAPRRGEVHHLRGGITLVDDSYNASPQAMARVLEMLASTPGRRVAVLGEMRELGSTAPELHRQLGELAARSADVVVAVGPEHAVSIAAGAQDTCVAHAPNAAAALEAMPAIVHAGDVVLVKGSRGIALDVVADGLKEMWR
jgi:UDP-N-acetylmuramoyl-tripeptide--D-alanyl-D-alanine ligase